MSRAWNILRATFSKEFCTVRNNFSALLSIQNLRMCINNKIQIKKAYKNKVQSTASEGLWA